MSFVSLPHCRGWQRGQPRPTVPTGTCAWLPPPPHPHTLLCIVNNAKIRLWEATSTAGLVVWAKHTETPPSLGVTLGCLLCNGSIRGMSGGESPRSAGESVCNGGCVCAHMGVLWDCRTVLEIRRDLVTFCKCWMSSGGLQR